MKSRGVFGVVFELLKCTSHLGIGLGTLPDSITDELLPVRWTVAQALSPGRVFFGNQILVSIHDPANGTGS